MQRCHECQNLLLEYLYDLLDGDELRQIDAHLAECDDCQSALRQAEQQKALLARAAKLDFSAHSFRAPHEHELIAQPADAAAPRASTPAPAKKVILPLSRPSRPRAAAWRAYLTAAAILMALSFGGWHVWGYRSAKSAVRNQETRIASLEHEQEKLQDRRATLARKLQDDLDSAERTTQEQRLKIEVSGPLTAVADTINKYHVRTLNGLDQPVPTELKYSVRALTSKLEEKDKSKGQDTFVYEGKSEAADGNHRLTLPPGIPLKPDTQLALELVAKRSQGSDKTVTLRENLELAAPVYLAHLTTDRPIYQPGDVVRFRSLVLERFRLRPAKEPMQLIYSIKPPLEAERDVLQGGNRIAVDQFARNKDGKFTASKTNQLELLKGPDDNLLRGVGGGEYQIPLDEKALKGGEFVLKVREANDLFPPQERKFLVQRYQKPRLSKKLDLHRKSYGPGDEVIVTGKAKVADGTRPVANRPVRVGVRVDGQLYDKEGKPATEPFEEHTNANGEVQTRFKLPKNVPQGEATVSFGFMDRAAPEPIVRPIPIVLKKMLVDFYPEGGDLVAGVPNRVYFQSRTTLGKPAELRGRIVGGDKQIAVATLSDDDEVAVNRGLGTFTFTPKAGRKYRLEVDVPIGIDAKPELPPVKESGVVLHLGKPVTTSFEPIGVTLTNVGAQRSLMIGAYCRGRLMDHYDGELVKKMKPGASVSVPLMKRAKKEQPVDDVGGVYRITVFEKKTDAENRPHLTPLAERLVYRDPPKKLNLDLKTTSQTYLPGDGVQVTVRASKEDQERTPAVVLLSVVDKRVLTVADEKTARTMPTHFLLTSELKKPEDIEYADFLLTPHPKAAQSLDLLLGTQGWRRFAVQDPEELRKNHPEDAERFLAATGRREETLLMAEAEKRDENAAQQEQLGILADYAKQVAPLESEQEESRNSLRAARAEAAYLAALTKREGYERFWRKLWPALLLLSLGLIMSIAAYLVAVRLRARFEAQLFFAPVTVCLLLVVVLSIGTHVAQRNARQEEAQAKRVALEHEKKRMPALGREWAKGKAETGNDDADRFKDLEQAGDVGAAIDLPHGRDRRPLAGAKPAPGQANDPATGKPLAKAPQVPAPTPPGIFPNPGESKGDKKADEGKAITDAAPGGGSGAAGPYTDPTTRNLADEVRRQRADFLRKEQNRVHRDLLELDYRNPEAKLAQQEKQAFPDARYRLGGGGLGGGGRGGFGHAARKQADRGPSPATFYLREYAFQSVPKDDNSVRSNFSETVYWHPVLVLPEGERTVTFNLSDSVTSYEVLAYGHTLEGRLGATTATIQAQLPFNLASTTPIEVTSGDTLDVPVSVANNSDKNREVQLKLFSEGLKVDDQPLKAAIPLLSKQQARRFLRMTPAVQEGEASLTITGTVTPFSDYDAVRRSINVVPSGFPVAESRSGMLDKPVNQEIQLPKAWIPGTLKLQVQAFPSTLADLQQGLDGMLRQPHGCFEQSSSSNYPNVMILNYLHETNQANPQLEARARGLMERGYAKLTSFECQSVSTRKREGYEWFGGMAPPHEALTAYGLLQFNDMAKVYPVSPQMMERTRSYLLKQADGEGFRRNTKAIDSFGNAPKNVTDAYVFWALSESGQKIDGNRKLESVRDGLHAQAKSSMDPYFVSLVANSLVKAGQGKDGIALLSKVAQAQQQDGSLQGATTSITSSGGRNLKIETTALALLGWLKAKPGTFEEPVRKAVDWLGRQRNPHGGFGSTQATVLTLKALLAHAKHSKRPQEAGELSLWIGKQRVAHRLFSAETAEVLELDLADAEKQMKPGTNNLQIRITGKNTFPYKLAWSYRTLQPFSDKNAPILLSTKLSKPMVSEGDTVQLSVQLKNVSGQKQGMAVAVVGLPGGLTLPPDLKQLKKHARPPADKSAQPLISAFELNGRELILYWRGLAAKQTINVPIELIGRVPGTYSGPASRAYLYYNPDHKHWIKPLKVAIRPNR